MKDKRGMAICVIVGYIKNFLFLPFQLYEKYVYESMTDRIDYIRSTNLDKKENFTLIPKFIGTIEDPLKFVVHLEKSQMPFPIKKNKKGDKDKPFLHVQKLPFYNSRPINVNKLRLDEIKTKVVPEVLVINYGDIEDIIKSAGNQIYQFKQIYINKNIETKRDKKFLETFFFKEDYLDLDYCDEFTIYNNECKELNIKRYTSLESLARDDTSHNDTSHNDTSRDDTIYMLLPSHKIDTYFPLYNYIGNLGANTLYLDHFNERISNTVIFGSYVTMCKLRDILKGRPVLSSKLGEHFKLEKIKFGRF